MVLISMIVLQSVPVTYVSGSDDSEWLNTEPSPTEKPDNADAEVTKYDYQSEDINVKVTLTDASDRPDNAKLVVTPVEISQEAQDQIENTKNKK